MAVFSVLFITWFIFCLQLYIQTEQLCGVCNCSQTVY